MNIDPQLINTAEMLLHEHFSMAPGLTSAAYSGQRQIFTGVSAKEESGTIEPEAGVISESQKSGELIAAIITLAWEGHGSQIAIRPPPPAIVELLELQSRRHAQIAVGGSINGTVKVKPLWELVLELGPLSYPNKALLNGRFGRGMKAIANELMGFAKEPGVVRTRAEFADVLIACLKHEEIRSSASTPGLTGSRFFTPTQLESVSLRHIWLAFELASETFTFSIIESLRGRLAHLGCNDADIVHIKQGLEALRNIFSVLIILTGTKRQVMNECPFYPYDSFRLKYGVPIDRYIPMETVDETQEVAIRNEALVRQLIKVLAERKEGGFTSYLRQRELFNVILFNGGGAGHCPFSLMSNELVYATAIGLERALDQRLVMLAPDCSPTLS